MLLPDASCLELEYSAAEQQLITLVVKTTPKRAHCPSCQSPSQRVHSRYRRTLADLPWQGIRVRWLLHSRKFFCSEPDCPQAVFTERLPSVTPPYGRQTCRFAQAVLQLGLALGGAAGARLAGRLGLRVSRDTLLRAVRHAPQQEVVWPQVLGVDDWAWKRRYRYGTILCDLERRRVADLLPDCEADSLARWLEGHPSVAVISRDRAGAYAEAASRGAPQAVQVADRWHLLRNLGEALQRVVERQQVQLRRAAESVAAARAARTPPQPVAEPQVSDKLLRQPSRAEQAKQERRSRRLARYTEALRLSEQGLSQVAIARRLSLSPRTLRRWADLGHCPEGSRPRRKRRLLDPFLPYLEERWASCHNALQLWREIRQQGFTGSAGLVRQWAAPRRQGPPAEPHRAIVPTTRQTAWLLLRDPADLQPEQQSLLEAFGRLSPPVEAASQLAREFRRMVRERDHEALSGWLEQAKGTEFGHFAAGLRRDEDAVRAALRLPWSNGQVEGQVHRLKLVKRQMYGRAKFDLLRARVLAAA
jgi:transposase